MGTGNKNYVLIKLQRTHEKVRASYKRDLSTTDIFFTYSIAYSILSKWVALQYKLAFKEPSVARLYVNSHAYESD